MATPNSKPSHAESLRIVMADLAAKRTVFMAGMAKGDLASARNANSADNDYKNLERIAKRYESGAYKG